MDNLQNKDWLRQKYIDEKLSMPQIGALLGVSKHPVYRALKKYGIAARVHTSKYPQLNDSSWLRDQYLVQRKSIKQIAGEINATVGTVHSALTHLGIKTRGLKESLAIKNNLTAAAQPATSWNDKDQANLVDQDTVTDDGSATALLESAKYDKLSREASKPGGTASMRKSIDEILRDNSGIRLDIGGGEHPNPGFVNIDILPFPEVDIVWDLENTPWPLPDECVIMATASHVLEHINPHKGTFIRVMDEIWRVMKPGAQFAFVVPHGESPGYIQDPTHCNQMNETTMHYFDPDPEGANMGPALYNFYHPKPWRIVNQYFNYVGNLEVLIEKRRLDRTFMYNSIDDSVPMDITKEARS